MERVECNQPPSVATGRDRHVLVLLCACSIAAGAAQAFVIAGFESRASSRVTVVGHMPITVSREAARDGAFGLSLRYDALRNDSARLEFPMPRGIDFTEFQSLAFDIRAVGTKRKIKGLVALATGDGKVTGDFIGVDYGSDWSNVELDMGRLISKPAKPVTLMLYVNRNQTPAPFEVHIDNIRLIGTGDAADASAEKPPLFVDVTKAVGLGSMDGGFCAWGDYDNDGDEDVMIGGRLWQNDADGTFSKARGEVAQHKGSWGDYDNDGWLDYYAIRGEGFLYHNNRDGTFTLNPNIPPNPHKLSRASAWADIDNDGFLDLYVSNYESDVSRPAPDLLFRNRGDGTFELHRTSPGGEIWSCRGVDFADFDNDGDADIYLSNYRLQPNVLLVNDGTRSTGTGLAGQFADEATARGVAGNPDGGHIDPTAITPKYPVMGHTIGSCWGDLNNDAVLDLLVVNFSHASAGQDRPMVCINSGPPDYRFTNINAGNAAGIYWQESYSKGALGDYDNDGDLDAYLATVYEGDSGDLFENDGSGHFTPRGDVLNLRTGQTYQLAWVDYDNDGDLDLMVAGGLFQNRSIENSSAAERNNWIKVRVIGGDGSNMSCVGARVRVIVPSATSTSSGQTGSGSTTGDRVFIREVTAGSSSNQSPLVQHFGLGAHRDKVRVEVLFPSGKAQVWQASPGKLLVAAEGAGSERQP